jgi:ABC-type polysaccharide/polyol phosphate transport system ATPase subunit
MELIYDLHDIDYICDMGARGALDDMNEIDYILVSHDMNDIEDACDVIMYSIGTHG